MIEVRLNTPEGIDLAFTDEPENAIFAARTMFDESCEAHPYQGWRRGLRTQFLVNGRQVRSLEGVRP